MKGILTIGIILLTILYTMPLVGLAQNDVPLVEIPQEAVSVDAQIATTTPKIETENDTTITVCIDGCAVRMPLEQYVMGVVAAEISPEFPTEAIKAQAVAARTYAVYKQQQGRSALHPDADVCDDCTHCAAYCDLTTQAAALWGAQTESYTARVTQAVQDTAGELVLYQGNPALTVFSAAATTMTESAADVWGTDIPYLQAVPSSGGESCPLYYGEVTFTATMAREIVQAQCPQAQVDGTPDTWCKASERSQAGGIIALQLGGVRVAGTTMRTLFDLPSTNFTISTTPDSITFHTIGYGHGVGLSQWGAKAMAEQGATYAEILTHYYTACTIGEMGA